MFHRNLRRLLAAGSFTSLVIAGTAHAGAIVTVDTSLTSLPTQGFTNVDLSGAPLGSGATFTTGGDTVSFTNVASFQGVVQGSSPNQYAAPVTDAKDDKFGGKYFSTGNTGSINIMFDAPQKALALLWGSVDDSNQITFLFNGVVIATLTGMQIDAGANGFQGFGGSFYTLINLDQSFNGIQLSSGVTSFEGAQFRADPNNVTVPEPATLALLGVGLLGLTLARRRSA